MRKAPDLLFVYGTLRKGFPLHKYLVRDIRFRSRGYIRGRLYDLGDFPGAGPSVAAGERIAGEVYELLKPETQFKKLDKLEEFLPTRPRDSLFVRKKTVVHLKGGRRVLAWAYLLPKTPENGRRLVSGNYAETRLTSAEASN